MEYLDTELGALGIMGGMNASCVAKSQEKAVALGMGVVEWAAQLLRDITAWRARTKRVKFVDYALTFEDVKAS